MGIKSVFFEIKFARACTYQKKVVFLQANCVSGTHNWGSTQDITREIPLNIQSTDRQ